MTKKESTEVVSTQTSEIQNCLQPTDKLQ